MTPKSYPVPVLRVSCVQEGTAQAQPGDSPSRIVDLLRQVVDLTDEREQFVAVYLDARSRIKGVSVVSIGTMTASLVHPREVFRPAVVLGAAGVVVAHNHPSGDTQPSAEDRETTRRLESAGRLLGVPLLDHVILAGDHYFSFREHGMMGDRP